MAAAHDDSSGRRVSVCWRFWRDSSENSGWAGRAAMDEQRTARGANRQNKGCLAHAGATALATTAIPPHRLPCFPKTAPPLNLLRRA